MTDIIPSFYRFVSSITITNAGAGYNNVPTITISGGGGTGATATAEVFSGAISKINITNRGSGYSSAPTITITPASGDTITTEAVLTATLDVGNSTATYEDRNFNYLLKSQVPDFIKEEYPTFVTFLEKYYMFMDQSDKQGHNILNYTTDIDVASSAFLDKWRGALATDFPRSLKVDRASFYKRAKDFYEAKGSKQSIELFFRLLFGENVTVNYPGQYVLKPSAGVYSKERAIKIQESEHGGLKEPLTLEGKKIDIRYYSTSGTVTILKNQGATVRRVEKNTYQTNGLTLQRFELILSFDEPNTTEVYGPGAEATATATVSSGAISAVTILTGGANYTAAPSVQITGDGTGATGVATVSNGVVTGVNITDGGSGYTSAGIVFHTEQYKANGGSLLGSDLRSYVVDDGAGNTASDIYGYLVRVLTGVTFKSYAGSATDAGFKIGQIYLINETGDDGRGYAIIGDGSNGAGGGYFFNHANNNDNYTFKGGANDAYVRVTAVTTAGLPSAFQVINPGSTFLDASTDIPLTSPSGEQVTVTMTTGYLFEYEGKWKDDQGKLSDVNVLQDNKRYQPYSYVIKSGIAQTDWDRRIRDTVHPAGMQVFGDLLIRSDISYNVAFSVSSTGYLFFKVITTTEVTTNDTVIAKDISMAKADTGSVTEAVGKVFVRGNESEAVQGQDRTSDPYVVDGYWNDSTDGNETDNYCKGNPAVEINIGKILATSTASVAESLSSVWNISRAFNNSTNIVDNGILLEWTKAFSDSTSHTDLAAKAFNKALTTSTSSVLDSPAKATGKTLATSTSSVTENLTKAWTIVRAFSNTGTASDSNPTFSIGQGLGSTGTASESHAIAAGKTLGHSTSNTDSEAIQTGKSVSDTKNASEAINSINTSKGITDSGSVTQAVANALSKATTNSASATDTGQGQMHDYCDPTYFAEAYVGTGWNFT